MGLFLVAVINTMSVLIILLLMKCALGAGFRLTVRRIAWIGIAFLLYDMVLETVNRNRWMEAGGVYLFMLVVLIIALPKKSMRHIFYLIPAILVYVSADELVKLAAEFFGAIEFTVNTQAGPVEAAPILADIFWIFLLFYFARELERRQIDLAISAWEAVFLTFFSLIFPFYGLVYHHMAEEGYSRRDQFLWLALCIILNAAVYRTFWHRRRTQYYRDISEAYARYYKAEYEQFLNYRRSQEEMDRFRHDLNNHFLVLKEMISGGQYEKASSYMNSLLENRPVDTYPILTGNEITDILMKMKYQKITELNIELRILGNFNVLSIMEPLDICVIFSNALDNALEACEKVEENRFIEIAAKEFSAYTMIYMKNPLPSDGNRKRLFQKTTKPNQAQHGFGIGNIRTALAKYNGELSYEQRENMMITRMVYRTSDTASRGRQEAEQTFL